jgi:excisionase family DNA binding protein
MEAKNKMYSVAQIAKRAGVSRIYVQKSIERKRLAATQIGRTWVIMEEDFQAWEASRKSHNAQQDT